MKALFQKLYAIVFAAPARRVPDWTEYLRQTRES